MKARGRPLKVVSAKHFKRAAFIYFQNCDKENKPITINGLALAVGLTTRQALLEYKDRAEYSDVVKEALTEVAAYWEGMLVKPACTGAIFWLKNHGWSDIQQVQQLNILPEDIDLTKLSDEEIQQLQAIQHKALKRVA